MAILWDLLRKESQASFAGKMESPFQRASGFLQKPRSYQKLGIYFFIVFEDLFWTERVCVRVHKQGEKQRGRERERISGRLPAGRRA